MFPALFRQLAFWDALLLLVWLAFAALIGCFALAAALTPQFAWSEVVVPLLSCAFVTLSAGRLIALHQRRAWDWLFYLGAGQLGASVALYQLASGAKSRMLTLVEHALAGSAGAIALFVLLYLIKRPPRPSQHAYIKELLRKREEQLTQ